MRAFPETLLLSVFPVRGDFDDYSHHLTARAVEVGAFLARCRRYYRSMTFEPIFFETAADAERAAVQLAALPGRVRNLLAESVEHQELFRTRISAAATTLADAGFLRIRDVGQQWAPRFVLTPTLSGEEALACLEQMQADEDF